MNSIRKPSLLLATVLALGAVAPPAAASSVPGSAGVTLNDADAGGFAESWGGLKNNCAASTKLLRFSLTVHAAGRNDVWIAAQGTGDSNDVRREVQTVTSDRIPYYGSGPTPLPSWSSSTQVYQLNSVYLPAGGSIFVNCYVRTGAFINNVSYTP